MLGLSDFVKQKRKEAHLTQEEFADKAGVSLTLIRKIEQRKVGLNMDKVNQVLKMFGHELAPVSSKEIESVQNTINRETIKQPEVDQFHFIDEKREYFLNKENKYTSPLIMTRFGQQYILETNYNSLRYSFSDAFGYKKGEYYSPGKIISVHEDLPFLSFECIRKPETEVRIVVKRIA